MKVNQSQRLLCETGAEWKGGEASVELEITNPEARPRYPASTQVNASYAPDTTQVNPSSAPYSTQVNLSPVPYLTILYSSS